MVFGWGILKGMAVTLKNLVTSYFCRPDRGGLFTVEYPEKCLPLAEKFRNLPFLVYDGTPANLRCTACDICARECPPKCILVVRDSDKDGKPLKRPAVFDIDFAVCMNCGICEEVCPFDAIFLDHLFEISGRRRQEDLLYHKEGLLKPAEYFHKIRPLDAAALDQRRQKAEEAKKAAAAKADAARQADGEQKPGPEKPA